MSILERLHCILNREFTRKAYCDRVLLQLSAAEGKTATSGSSDAVYMVISSSSVGPRSAATPPATFVRDFEGGLKGLDECEEEEMGSLAWTATGYFLLALPMADPDQDDDLGGGAGGGT